ncbi:MAG: HEAT repeat domain-containing protein, partial [Elusimicrobia bacterium]|nr:HEAT repeat domain-containing protein [Elusimicrobiota bacterium]
ARAAEMIRDIGPKASRAEPALRKALADRSGRVRSDAALALGAVTAGSDRAVKTLERLLRDKDPDVRYSAAAALGRVGTPKAEKAFNRYFRAESRRGWR